MTTRPSAWILLIEDDALFREFLFNTLTEAGYMVRAANNGVGGLALARSMSAPSLVIVDVVMPIVDGLEVIRVLRADETLKHTPILAVSAAESEREVRPEAFLRKPFEPRELLAWVKRLTSGEDDSGHTPPAGTSVPF